MVVSVRYWGTLKDKIEDGATYNTGPFGTFILFEDFVDFVNNCYKLGINKKNNLTFFTDRSNLVHPRCKFALIPKGPNTRIHAGEHVFTVICA